MTTEKRSIFTPTFRVSFPWVVTPRAQEREDGTKGDPKYGVTAVWTPAKFSPRDKELWKGMMQLADEVSLAAFKKRWKDLPANFKKGLRDGAEKEGLEGFGPGMMFASLTTSRKPMIVGREKEIIDGSELYAGCFAMAKVNCYSYNNKGKGIAFGLQSLMKVKDGPRIDGGSDATKDFADHEITAEDEKWLAAQGATDGDTSDDGGF